MSNEMLIVYLYGIYPDGGLSMTMVVMSLLLMGVYVASYDTMLNVGNKEKREKIIKEKGFTYQKIEGALKVALVNTAMVLVVGYFIPSKNVFLAMVATPSIVESLESKTGKLNKVSRLLDKALDEALEGEKDD